MFNFYRQGLLRGKTYEHRLESQFREEFNLLKRRSPIRKEKIPLDFINRLYTV